MATNLQMCHRILSELCQWHGGERITRLRNMALLLVGLTQGRGIHLSQMESGGDNLSAAFSPELVDVWIYVIDVSAGDKIPRKSGPGITRSDLLVINKIDLAPHVGASPAVMERDTLRMRGEQPFLFTNLKEEVGLPDVLAWIEALLNTPHVARAVQWDGRLSFDGSAEALHHHH